eukprot:757479-Hanusia_phi.AAC.1
MGMGRGRRRMTSCWQSIRTLLMKESETWKGAWKKMDEEISDEKLKVTMTVEMTSIMQMVVVVVV